MKINILIPVYNDWQSVFKLLDEINLSLKNLEHEVSVIIINDASNHDREEEDKDFENINSLKILNMKINQGHGRCIATGLKYIFEKENFDYVIPMDGDGEDRPEEIKNFIDQISNSNIQPIVGERVKRSEDLIFKICYQLHKLITLTFTGKTIKFGNFTCLPKSVVSQMVNESATWSSFSGSLSKITKERKSIRSIRGIRYFGPSKMSFYNLIKHSFSIISVFKFTVLIRSLIFLTVYLFIISKNISLITLIPVVFATIMNISTFFLSKRENIYEFNKSLENIDHVEVFK